MFCKNYETVFNYKKTLGQYFFSSEGVVLKHGFKPLQYQI